MQNVEFTYDKEGYGYSYAPTLESRDIPGRDALYAIHDNRADPNSPPFAVSIFPVPEPEAEGWTIPFGDIREIQIFFRSVGLTFNLESEPVRRFLSRA